MATGNVCAQQGGMQGKGKGGCLCHPLVQRGAVSCSVELGVACALSVISLLLIQKFFALLKSDHNDNYTSVTVTGRAAWGRGLGHSLQSCHHLMRQDLCAHVVR